MGCPIGLSGNAHLNASTVNIATEAKRFPVVIIDGIPCMVPDDVNTAYRFITIVDALYDNGNLLFASAEALPDQLFTEGEVADAFARTASRLVEMGSKSWLEHGAEAARIAHSY